MKRARISQVATAMGCVRIGIGALALLAPSRSARVLSLPPEQDTAAARTMGRLFGVRDVALGAMILRSAGDADELRYLCGLNAAVDAGDAASFAVSIARREGMDRGAVSMASVAVPAAGLWLLLRAHI